MQADSGLAGIGRVSSAELLTPAALEKSASSVSSSEKVFKLLCVFCQEHNYYLCNKFFEL
jgi:hypothetical protein